MLYFQLFRFSFLKFFTYPVEILANVMASSISLAFFIYFWFIVSQVNNNIDLNFLVSYFFVATGVSKLVMALWGEFGGAIGRWIYLGLISNYLMKPYSPIFHIHALSLGKEGVQYILSILMILTGILINPPQSPVALLLFAMFFICAYAIAFGVNLILGSAYFHFAEGSHFYNGANLAITLLSGFLVPITFFPDPYRQIVMLSPFPGMVFGPVNALRINSITGQVLIDLAVVIFWSVSVNIIAWKFWRYSVKKYEAIGI